MNKTIFKGQTAVSKTFLEIIAELSPKMLRVLDFFIMYPNYDYSKATISKELGIGKITLGKLWTGLVQAGFIKQTREVGRSKLYALNRTNPMVILMMKMDFEINSMQIEAIRQAEALAISKPTFSK
jgi:DNA-binding transcriptional ArsR family regulator